MVLLNNICGLKNIQTMSPKKTILTLFFSFLAFVKTFGAGYTGTVNNFNVTRTSGCTGLAISFSSITITINSKTSAKIKFSYKYASNVAAVTRELTGKITSTTSSIVIDFGNLAATSSLCSPNAVAVNLKFYGGPFGTANISGYLEAKASGAYVGTGKSSPNNNIPYVKVESPRAVVEQFTGNSICASTTFNVRLFGDNYQPIYVLVDDQRVGTAVATDDLFSVSKGFFSNSMTALSKLFPTTILATDGATHTIKLEVNGVKTTVKTFRSYNPFSNVQLVASKNVSCYGQPITLTVNTTGANYAWSDGSTAAATYTINTPTTKKYFVTVSKSTDKVCPLKTNEVSIQAFPNFTATITADKGQACKGQPIQLKVTPNDATQYNYTWSGATGTTNSLAVTQAGSYKVTVTPKNGCAAKESNTITNLKFDEPIPTTTVSPATILCNKTSGVNLQATPIAGVGIRWNTGSTASTINVKDAGTYTATFTRGACVVSRTVSVKEEELKVSIAHKTSASSIIVCSGTAYQAYELNATSNQSNATIRWKLNNEATNAAGTNTGAKYTPTTAGNFYAIAEVAGCKSKLSNAIRVNAVPSFTVSLTPLNPAAICDGSSVTLTAKPSYTSSLIAYSWLQDTKALTPKTATLAANAEGKYTVNILQEGCKATASTQITTKISKPTITLVDNTKMIASESPDGYEWYFKELPASTNISLYKAMVPIQKNQELQAPQPGSYSVRASRNGCPKAFSNTVEVSMITAIEDTQSDTWNIYPNPTSGSITIENNSTDFMQNNLIELRNSAGILVKYWVQDEKSKEYSIEELTSGVYHLIFTQKNKRISKKIVKL